MGHCHIEPGTLPATFVEELTMLWQPVLPVELNATLEFAAGADGTCDAGGLRDRLSQ